MCATAGAAGLELLDCCWTAAGATEAGDVRRGSWGGRCNVGGVTLASRALHALHRHTGPWAAEKAPGQAAAATYLYDHRHHTPPRQQLSFLVDAPSSCPHTAPVADYTGSPLLPSHPRRPSRPRPAAP
jgi:hypothetical protein